MTALAKAGLMARVDILSVEVTGELWDVLDGLAGRKTKPSRRREGATPELYAEVAKWMHAPQMRVCFETLSHHGIDKASAPPPLSEQKETATRCRARFRAQADRGAAR